MRGDKLGLFESIFRKPKMLKAVNGYFQTFTAYAPVFTTWQGGIYESELVRSAIHARATHISKLSIAVNGDTYIARRLSKVPNEFQTWGQFLYRLSTILDVQNTAFIVPIEGNYGTPIGVYPVLPSRCELVDYEGELWLRYTFSNGEHAAVEFRKCGILTKFQYKDDFFGEKNDALIPTMDLISIQSQGIAEAVKSSATFRFMARMTNFQKTEDIAKEQKRFTKENLSADAGGVLLFPNNWSDIQQIKSAPFVVDADQMNHIKENVFNYLGVNEDILQNKAFGDKWSAFYEGGIEPFAIQCSDVLQRMVFSESQIDKGDYIRITANRLQYMTNAEKLNVSSQMSDRGIMNRDEIREIWNLPPLPNGEGQAYTIRGEYYFIDEGGKSQTIKKEKEGEEK